jgi:hypothetical protein
MALPLIKDNDPNFQLMQTQWKAQLDPILAEPLNDNNFLQNILVSTTPLAINHQLGRKPLGWFVVDTDGAAEIYRSAPFDPKTLTLTSTAPVTISLVVF